MNKQRLVAGQNSATSSKDTSAHSLFLDLNGPLPETAGKDCVDRPRRPMDGVFCQSDNATACRHGGEAGANIWQCFPTMKLRRAK